MDIKIEGNPGTGNKFLEIKQEVHIGVVHQYNQATTMNNYYGSAWDPLKEKELEKGTKDDATDDPELSDPNAERIGQLEEPEEEIDRASIRAEILQYVSRVRPLVHPDKRDRYMKMWEGILELDAVRPFVYKTGKQKQTNFNRKLIANIIHHLDSRQMYAKPYKASDFAKALEGDYDTSVRGELGKFPSDNICAAIDKYLEEIGLYSRQ